MLRKRSTELAELTGLRDIVTDATETMLEMNGSGMALVQIGIPLRIVVLNCGGRTVTLVNPIIVYQSGQVIAKELCLSLPGRVVEVQRYAHVRVEHLRPHGVDTINAEEPELAVALQHEIDHLNGVLTLDRGMNLRPNVTH